MAADRRLVELEHDRSGRQVEGWQEPRVQLPHPAGGPTLDQDPRRAPGMQGGVARRLGGDARGPGERLYVALDVEEVDRALALAPLLGLGRTVGEPCDAP